MNRHSGLRVVLGLALSSVALVALQPATVGHATAPSHKKPVSFGAKLTGHSQPSNSFQPVACESDTGIAGPCTRVLMEALGRPDTGALAPKNGTIGTIKIVAGDSGSFRLEIAKVKPATKQAEIVVKGPVITYNGQGGVDNGSPYTVESFPVNVPVLKGEYLAIKADGTSLLQCSGGGLNQLLFQPPLKKGAGYATATKTDGCLLLLEAVYK
jgi:hypothetical protein